MHPGLHGSVKEIMLTVTTPCRFELRAKLSLILALSFRCSLFIRNPSAEIRNESHKDI